MAVANFDFDTEERSTIRSSPRNRHEIEHAYSVGNTGTLTNGKSKIVEPLPEYGHRMKSPMDLHIKPIISEYEDSEGVIYQQANGTRVAYHPSWPGRKANELSLSTFVGVQDVCGNKKLWKMLLAEFIGSLFLILIGCGACLSWSTTNSPGTVQNLQIAFAFGIAVATMVQALGPVHLNPAVSVGLVAAGQCSVLRALCNICVQCVGGICGAGILQAITPEEIRGNLGMNLLNEKMDPVQGMFLEALVTFVLVITVCGVSDDMRTDVKNGPLSVGLAVAVCHLMAIPYTGSAINPMRALAPSVITNIWTSYHWIYWSGPMLGGICAGFLYQVSFKERPSNDNMNSESLDKSASRP